PEAECVAVLCEVGVQARHRLSVVVDDPELERLDPLAQGVARPGGGHQAVPLAEPAPAPATEASAWSATGVTLTGVSSTAVPAGMVRTCPSMRKLPSRVVSSLEAPSRTRNSPGSTMRCRSGPVKALRAAGLRVAAGVAAAALRALMVEPGRVGEVGALLDVGSRRLRRPAAVQPRSAVFVAYAARAAVRAPAV